MRCIYDFFSRSDCVKREDLAQILRKLDELERKIRSDKCGEGRDAEDICAVGRLNKRERSSRDVPSVHESDNPYFPMVTTARGFPSSRSEVSFIIVPKGQDTGMVFGVSRRRCKLVKLIGPLSEEEVRGLLAKMKNADSENVFRYFGSSSDNEIIRINGSSETFIEPPGFSDASENEWRVESKIPSNLESRAQIERGDSRGHFGGEQLLRPSLRGSKGSMSVPPGQAPGSLQRLSKLSEDQPLRPSKASKGSIQVPVIQAPRTSDRISEVSEEQPLRSSLRRSKGSNQVPVAQIPGTSGGTSQTTEQQSLRSGLRGSKGSNRVVLTEPGVNGKVSIPERESSPLDVAEREATPEDIIAPRVSNKSETLSIVKPSVKLDDEKKSVFDEETLQHFNEIMRISAASQGRNLSLESIDSLDNDDVQSPTRMKSRHVKLQSEDITDPDKVHDEDFEPKVKRKGTAYVFKRHDDTPSDEELSLEESKKPTEDIDSQARGISGTVFKDKATIVVDDYDEDKPHVKQGVLYEEPLKESRSGIKRRATTFPTRPLFTNDDDSEDGSMNNSPVKSPSRHDVDPEPTKSEQKDGEEKKKLQIIMPSAEPSKSREILTKTDTQQEPQNLDLDKEKKLQVTMPSEEISKSREPPTQTEYEQGESPTKSKTEQKPQDSGVNEKKEVFSHMPSEERSKPQESSTKTEKRHESRGSGIYEKGEVPPLMPSEEPSKSQEPLTKTEYEQGESPKKSKTEQEPQDSGVDEKKELFSHMPSEEKSKSKEPLTKTEYEQGESPTKSKTEQKPQDSGVDEKKELFSHMPSEEKSKSQEPLAKTEYKQGESPKKSKTEQKPQDSGVDEKKELFSHMPSEEPSKSKEPLTKTEYEQGESPTKSKTEQEPQDSGVDEKKELFSHMPSEEKSKSREPSTKTETEQGESPTKSKTEQESSNFPPNTNSDHSKDSRRSLSIGSPTRRSRGSSTSWPHSNDTESSWFDEKGNLNDRPPGEKDEEKTNGKDYKEEGTPLSWFDEHGMINEKKPNQNEKKEKSQTETRQEQRGSAIDKTEEVQSHMPSEKRSKSREPSTKTEKRHESRGSAMDTEKIQSHMPSEKRSKSREPSTKTEKRHESRGSAMDTEKIQSHMPSEKRSKSRELSTKTETKEEPQHSSPDEDVILKERKPSKNEKEDDESSPPKNNDKGKGGRRKTIMF